MTDTPNRHPDKPSLFNAVDRIKWLEQREDEAGPRMSRAEKTLANARLFLFPLYINFAIIDAFFIWYFGLR